MKHAVHQLFEQRLAQSTRPFRARGGRVKRCAQCRIDENYCLCALRPHAQSNAGFLILYYDDEILKPSNTGKLMADLFPDTFAYIWQRTTVEADLTALLSDPKWCPVVVFPSEYASPERVVFNDELHLPNDRRPLFVFFDGSWREAKKMFRNSPYLDSAPLLSITPNRRSNYQIRKASRDLQLSTAEVASYVLDTIGESSNAELLRAWFDLFSYRYQMGVKRQNKGDPTAEARLIACLAEHEKR